MQPRTHLPKSSLPRQLTAAPQGRACEPRDRHSPLDGRALARGDAFFPPGAALAAAAFARGDLGYAFEDLRPERQLVRFSKYLLTTLFSSCFQNIRKFLSISCRAHCLPAIIRDFPQFRKKTCGNFADRVAGMGTSSAGSPSPPPSPPPSSASPAPPSPPSSSRAATPAASQLRTRMNNIEEY